MPTIKGSKKNPACVSSSKNYVDKQDMEVDNKNDLREEEVLQVW